MAKEMQIIFNPEIKMTIRMWKARRIDVCKWKNSLC